MSVPFSVAVLLLLLGQTALSADSVSEAIEILEEEPVTRMEYGLHRAESLLEERLSVLTRHPAGPRSLSVGTAMQGQALMLRMTAIYSKGSDADCQLVIGMIKRELRLSPAFDPIVREKRAGDLLETWFMDPMARLLAPGAVMDLTIYNGWTAGARKLLCETRLLGEEIIERR